MIKNEKPLKFLWKFFVVSQIYHIWSLDHQRHRKHAIKFSWIAIFGLWIVSVKSMWQSFLESPCLVIISSSVMENVTKFLKHHIWSLHCQCNGMWQSFLELATMCDDRVSVNFTKYCFCNGSEYWTEGWFNNISAIEPKVTWYSSIRIVLQASTYWLITWKND